MIFDIAVLAILIISSAIAFLRGFIREILTIFGVAGGLVAAWFGGKLLFPIVRGWFHTDNPDDPQKLFNLIPFDFAAMLISYGSIFIIVVIVLSIASHFLAVWARTIGLGAIDRTMGVIFGLLRGVLILGFLYLPIHVMISKETQDKWFKGSKTHFYVTATANSMMALFPDSIKEDMTKRAEDTAESVTKSTREKLQELDVLGGDKDKNEKNSLPALPENKNKNNNNNDDEDGYQKEQRQDMKQLFKEHYNE